MIVAAATDTPSVNITETRSRTDPWGGRRHANVVRGDIGMNLTC